MESNSIFYLEVNKIKPNPYQPRRDFNEEYLKELAESIKSMEFRALDSYQNRESN